MDSKVYIVTFAMAVALAFSLGCAEDKPPIPATTDAQSNTIRIVFNWPGDDLASQQELAIRDEIAQKILQQGIGKIVRSGTGMGWMDIVVAIEDRANALREIEKIVRDLSPESSYTIQ